MDVYTLGLMIGTAAGANQVTQEYTGRSIVTRWQERCAGVLKRSRGRADGVLRSERAGAAELRAEGEKILRGDIHTSDIASRVNAAESGRGSGSGVLDEIKRKRIEEDQSATQRDSNSWKAQRDKREREALEEGRTYADLILDQIWEVWNWGQDQVEDARKKDEEILREKENGRRT
jgi:hypothetical protein